MRYLSIVSVLPTVDGGQRTLSWDVMPGIPAWKLSHVLLWMGPGVKLYFNLF